MKVTVQGTDLGAVAQRTQHTNAALSGAELQSPNGRTVFTSSFVSM